MRRPAYGTRRMELTRAAQIAHANLLRPAAHLCARRAAELAGPD